ncbi:unnamed protein product [Hapterophycus canaliculatus]
MASLPRRRRRAAPSTSPLLTRALGAACLAGATTLSSAFVTPGCCAGLYSSANTKPDVNVAAAAAAAVAASASTTAMLRQRNADLGGSRDGRSRHRRNQFAMASAIAEAPAATTASTTCSPTAAEALAASTSGRRQRGTGWPQPLTVEEERGLLSKIKEARLLRGIQRDLELASVSAGKTGRRGKGRGKGQGKGKERNERDGDGSAVEGVAWEAVPTEVWASEAGLEVDELSRVLTDAIKAKQTLVERNLPMVIHMVNGQYRWRLRDGQVSTADLIQEGAYALGVAADKFDPSMPNRFLTYALYTVRDKLDIAVARGNSAISVPASALKELQRAKRDLTGELGRSPSEAELAHFFANGVVADRVAPALTAAAAAEAAALSGHLGDGVSGGATGGASGLAGGESRTHPEGGQGEAVRSSPVVAATAGEFSIKVASNEREERQQARTRRRRLNLLSAVQKVTSIDRLIRASDGSAMVPLVDTLDGDVGGGGVGGGGGGDISELLPRVLTPRQVELVKMACGLADGRPMSMAECSKELSLSLTRTKSLFDSSLETLRQAAAADNPSRLVRQP